MNALVFTRDRRVLRTSIPFTTEAEREGSLYIVTPNTVSNKIQGGKIRGSEALLWEDHPIPIGIKDNSAAHLNRILYENLIENTSDAPRSGSAKKVFVAIVAILIGCLIIYGVYSSGIIQGML